MKKVERNLYIRYGYYRDYLEKISRMPLHQKVKVMKLKLSRGAVQMAYKEMEAEQFQGNIADYLVWVGGMFMLKKWAERLHGEEQQPVLRKRAERLLLGFMENEPDCAMLLLRAYPNIRACDIKSLFPEADGFSQFQVAYDTVQSVLGKLTFEDNQLDEGSALRKQGLIELTKYFLRIQEVTPVSAPSSYLSQTTTETTTNSIPPIPTRAPSGASSEAKRSEASSDKAPSGAAQEAERSEASSERISSKRRRGAAPSKKRRRTTRP